MNGDEQADISAREYARKWLPYSLADDEMHEPNVCPEHGKMSWWKGKFGEQNWYCEECTKGISYENTYQAT